jgi:hypothetical protein
MKLFPQDSDVVLYETGFEDDILERKSISKQLSDFVERIEDPVVLALDDKWGSGKTFFLKRWVAAHNGENEGKAITVYFDAFENDYLSDPLVSIITALSTRIPDDQEATLKTWKRVAAKLAKPAFGIALSLATFGAKQQLDEIGDVITEAAGGELKDATQDLWDAEKERKNAVQAFKDLLVKLTQDAASPIVIVIDELDRCRPDYALSVLEVIKHFFTVPKVHFILGINGRALENSVKARYGSDIDAESYLRKFINVSFSLPRTLGRQGEVKVISKYASKLIADMDLPKRVSGRCVNLLEYVAQSREVSLRDVGKVLSKVALLPSEVHEKNYMDGYIDILCVLLVTSVVDPRLHEKFLSGNTSASEVRDFLMAPREKTAERIDDQHNAGYDHDVTLWLVIIIFCCGVEDISEVDDLPPWIDTIGKQFDRFGVRDRKSIPVSIQKDWVELFKI